MVRTSGTTAAQWMPGSAKCLGLDLIVTTCTSPFDAASHRKLCYRTTIRNIEKSYGPQVERGARSWEDITQAKEMKDDALFPCCFVCEEAEAWLMKSRTSNPPEPFNPRVVRGSWCGWQWGQHCRLRAPWPCGSAGGAGGAILNPQSRGDGWMSPSEIILQQKCNCSTGQHLWPALTVWVCGRVSKLLVFPLSPASAIFS